MIKGLINFEPSQMYHIVNHAVGDENIFRADDNYRYFLEKMSLHLSPVFDTYAYCLMPNHFHLLAETKPLESIVADPKYKGNPHDYYMQKISNLLNGYAKAYNNMYDRKGALFIDYTKRFLIDSDKYFTNTIAYIHLNPVLHGFVKNLNDWPHSSYHSHISDKTTRLKRAEVLNWFGNQSEFRKFHENAILPLNMEFEF